MTETFKIFHFIQHFLPGTYSLLSDLYLIKEFALKAF